MLETEHKFTTSFVCDQCGMTRKEAYQFDELVKVLASQAGYQGGAGPSMDEIREEAKRRLEEIS
jgi:hypothetical protein